MRRHSLNSLVLTLAPPFEARATAPACLADLMSARSLARLPVWDGASDCTIYGDARVNHAFRAWHDAAHIAGGFGFTLEGEIAACEYQIREALIAFPRIPMVILSMIRHEVIGQAQYFATNGMFPANQIEFHLTNGGI